MAKKPFLNDADERSQMEFVDRETGEVRVRTHRGSYYEDPDPTPFSASVNVRPKESLEERMRRMIRDEMSYQAEQQGMESFEEADDFDVDDEGDPVSMYEIPWEPAFEPRNPAPPRPEVRQAEVKATTPPVGKKSKNSNDAAPAAPSEESGT